MTYAELADIFAGMAWSKELWLRGAGRTRGEMDVMQRRREMEACQRAAVDYRRAAERQESKGSAA